MDKKSPTILVDMDCILVSMLPTWIDAYNAGTGENVRVDDIEDYNLAMYCKNEKLLYEILTMPGFFDSMNPMPHAVMSLQTLMTEGYDVVIVTQPPRASDFAVGDKKAWIRRYFPSFDLTSMIFCHRKDMIMGDLLFDDRPSHLIDWKKTNPNGLAATLDWKYNRVPELDYVVDFRGSLEDGWLGFVDFVHLHLPLK